MRPIASACLLLVPLFAAACTTTQIERAAPEPAEKTDAAAAAHELAVARASVRVAELGLESKMAESRAGLVFAEQDLEEARRALAAFRDVERPHTASESQLQLDQVKNRLLDTETELAELESMYDGDDFAEKTKELVLARGRRNLEVARRAVALAELEHAHLTEHTLPVKDRELVRELEEAELAHAEARRALERATLEGEMGVAKAKHELATKEKEQAAKAGGEG